MENMDKLTGIMLDEIMKGAADYATRKGIKMTNEQITNTTNQMRKIAIDAMKTALADAKEAFDAHMDQIAIQTAMATMRLAGINAAKAVVG